jgi:hypothetical protein
MVDLSIVMLVYQRVSIDIHSACGSHPRLKHPRGEAQGPHCGHWCHGAAPPRQCPRRRDAAGALIGRSLIHYIDVYMCIHTYIYIYV